MKEDFKKIGKFLKGLEPVEYRYLELSVQMVSSIQNLIERHKLTKEEFCEMFHIKPTKYLDYTKGNYNYSLNDMATLNYVYRKLETEKLKETEPIKLTE